MLLKTNCQYMHKIKDRIRTTILFTRLSYDKSQSLYIRKRIMHKGYQLLYGSINEETGELLFSLVGNFNGKVEIYKFIIKQNKELT